MLVKLEDIILNAETIRTIQKTNESSADIERKLNSPKYIVINWRGADVSNIDFKEWSRLGLIDDEQMINDDEVVKAFFKAIETSDESFLWCALVENNRTISNELYLKNTYDENLAIYCKVRKIKELLK